MCGQAPTRGTWPQTTCVCSPPLAAAELRSVAWQRKPSHGSLPVHPPPLPVALSPWHSIVTVNGARILGAASKE